MSVKNTNILVTGLLQTGSSALIDLLREYDNISFIDGEFNDFRAPGLVADQLHKEDNFYLPNRINDITNTKVKLQLIYKTIPVFNRNAPLIKGLRGRYQEAILRNKQLILLKKLNKRLASNVKIEDKIVAVNKWITDLGKIYTTENRYLVFNQPISPGISTTIWTKVFQPFKLIIVYRDPKDQLADIIKKNYLYMPYGAPYMNLGGLTLESIYGRSRKGAIAFHIDAIRERMMWVDKLKATLDPGKLLLIDFEGLANNYEAYKNAVENFIGEIAPHHKEQKHYFDLLKAKNSINIFHEYLNTDEIESLNEADKWYKEMIAKNNVVK
jgi:hypothetical protein